MNPPLPATGAAETVQPPAAGLERLRRLAFEWARAAANVARGDWPQRDVDQAKAIFDLALDEHGAQAADALSSAEQSRDFYKRRCDLLQKWQSTMRDPERVLVCDVLANGQLLYRGDGRLDVDRYGLASDQHSASPPLQGRDVARRQDMGPGHFRLAFDSENDVVVEVFDGKRSTRVEFCTTGSGGGRSPHTRQALLGLMAAMERDNLADPSFEGPHYP